MDMTFKAFAKKLFGADYKKLTHALLINLILFWGLSIADFKIGIAPSILYLMVSSFTAGVMWQSLSSQNNAAYMQNLFMLPFAHRKLIVSYVTALGIDAFFTKTATLLAVILAVSTQKPAVIAISIICAVNAALMAAAVRSLKKYWYMGILWSAALISAILLLGNQSWFVGLTIGSTAFAVVLLHNANAYSFYPLEKESIHTVKAYNHDSIRRYLFRYLKCHKNYLINTGVMWCAACILPIFFKQTGTLSAAPVGFAILSLNTPICILLSCDPALEQAVRFLPGQTKKFCIPYCLFLSCCNMTADLIFLGSMQLQNGGVTVRMIAAAIFFSLQSAICSVLLEWFYPIRNWKIESDLWHHPRKYMVPAVMLLLAGAVAALPMLVPVLILLLAVEVIVLLSVCFQGC